MAGPNSFRSDIIRDSYGNARLLFVFVHPTHGPVSVIDAYGIEDAWIIATGWEDQAGIEQRKRQGWKLLPCTVEWDA